MAPEELAVWREGDVVVVRRDRELPLICMLSGQAAARTVKCYFHWQERPAPGTPLGLVRHYVQDVWNVTLDIPLAGDLLRRRRIGWMLFALTVALAIATVACLVVAQMQIAQMPARADKQWWNDLGVPILAVAGFLLTGLAGWGSYLNMPMPAHPAYLDGLPIADERQG